MGPLTVTLGMHEALLTLGMAATVGCDGCIEHHVDDAVEAGASTEEIQKTIALARHLGGEPSTICCDQALAVLSSAGDLIFPPLRSGGGGSAGG